MIPVERMTPVIKFNLRIPRQSQGYMIKETLRVAGHGANDVAIAIDRNNKEVIFVFILPTV